MLDVLGAVMSFTTPWISDTPSSRSKAHHYGSGYPYTRQSTGAAHEDIRGGRYVDPVQRQTLLQTTSRRQTRRRCNVSAAESVGALGHTCSSGRAGGCTACAFEVVIRVEA